MGTVWVFKPTDEYHFKDLCISRMVERFGKDESNWEHIEFESDVSTKKKVKKSTFIIIIICVKPMTC